MPKQKNILAVNKRFVGGNDSEDLFAMISVKFKLSVQLNNNFK